MARGIKINFDDFGAQLSLDEEVSGFDASVQCALVNVGTIAGTDIVYPNKGTNLLTKANKGSLITDTSAQHAANFAALTTEFFYKTLEEGTETRDNDSINELNLTLVEFNSVSATFAADITSLGGATITTTSVYV